MWIIATFDINWNDFGTLRVKLIVVSLLALSEPAGLDQSDPTIVTEDGRYESFHLLCDLLVGSLILLNALKNAVLTIDLCTQFARVVIFVVKCKLGFYPDGPVEFPLYVTNLYILLRSAHL